MWFPLTFPEEQYNVARLSDLYLNFIDALGDALEQNGRREEATALDEAVEGLPRGDEERRASAALDLLLGMAKQMDRRLVLLVDNLDLVLERLEDQEGAQWAFRELLSQEPSLLLIGAMPVVIGATYEYGAPFYDFFRIHELRGLTRAETRGVLTRLAQEQNAPQVERLLEHDPARIDTLHTLTGGNPRTIALLFGVLARGTDGDVRSDLEKLLDQCTPLYKARFESLSPQAQQVVDAVAIHWDPISAGELTEKLPMEVNAISAQLNRLVQQGVIEKVEYHPATKTGFQVAERFFNIWYLMRASRRVRRRLIWLVQFLRLFYGADQVKTKARDLLQNVLRGSSDEKLRHAEFCLAVAQLIEDDRSMRFALESHAIRTLLTDTALTEQLTTMLDLDGEDVNLRGVVDREQWLEQFNNAIETAGLDAKEKERARDVIAAAAVPRHRRLVIAQRLRGQSKKERGRLYDSLQKTAVQVEELYGPSLARNLRRALAEGVMDGVKDFAGAALASVIFDSPELEVFPGNTMDLDQLQAAYRRAPQSHFVAAVLAGRLTDTGQYEEARPLLDVLQAGERSVMADYSAGLVLQGLGLPEQAVEFLERAVTCAIAPRGMWVRLAAVQSALGVQMPPSSRLNACLRESATRLLSPAMHRRSTAPDDLWRRNVPRARLYSRIRSIYWPPASSRWR